LEEAMTTHEGEHVLEPRFVEPAYFLCRIREFEQRYDRPWWAFLADYTKGESETGSSESADYAEWAFLCENFLSELVRLDSEDPPDQIDDGNAQEPGGSPGSCFERRSVVRRKPIFLARG
jgi:hypothetical protein